MEKKTEMSEAARRARNAYAREWNRKNPEKVKAARARHWEKVAQQMEARADGSQDDKKLG